MGRMGEMGGMDVIELKDAGWVAIGAVLVAGIKSAVVFLRGRKRDEDSLELRWREQLLGEHKALRDNLNDQMKGLKDDLDRAWSRVRDLEGKVGQQSIEIINLRVENQELKRKLDAANSRVAELERKGKIAGGDVQAPPLVMKSMG